MTFEFWHFTLNKQSFKAVDLYCKISLTIRPHDRPSRDQKWDGYNTFIPYTIKSSFFEMFIESQKKFVEYDRFPLESIRGLNMVIKRDAYNLIKGKLCKGKVVVLYGPRRAGLTHTAMPNTP